MAGLFDLERILASGLTPEALLGSQQAQDVLSGAPQSVVPQMIEPNPSPVAAGAVPMPQPNPQGVTPEQLAAANGGAGAVNLTPPPADNLGAVLAGNAPAPDVTSLAARAPAAGAEGPVAPGPENAQASMGAQRPSLAQALKGTGGIKPPEVQRISSPNAPRPTGTIKGGELQALLMALNAGGTPGKPVRLGG
jgi:hypothetical protein